MATQGDVKPLVTLTRERITTSSTVPRTFSTGAYGYFEFDIAKTGKKPLGIVGVTGSETASFAFEDFYFDNETKATVYVRNVSSATATINNMKIDVLYIDE